MSDRKKPKLLIIGHGRHGKDTFAELISELCGLTFASSSEFVGREFIWEMWGDERYDTFSEMFEDRSNHRTLWGNLISAYNTPDKSRTATTMPSRGNHKYVGMRRWDEWDSCVKQGVFDYVIWVDACRRLDKEDSASMELQSSCADIFVDNNGLLDDLKIEAIRLQKKFHTDGFDVSYESSSRITLGYIHNKGKPHHPDPFAAIAKAINYDGVDTQPQLEDRLEWTDKPKGAFQVLDHGFLEVKEVMGSDTAIADSARMSYGRGTKKVNNDGGLINYLVHNHHTSPLEMGEIRFHMRLPIFVMRQLVRHRTANLNEYSGRYSQMVRLFYVPNIAQICVQDKVNKQGSAEPMDKGTAVIVQDLITEASNSSFNRYETMLEEGVSRETARMILPLNTYTECVWKLDVSNLIKFLYLRDDSHAQWEIRVYARMISDAVEKHFPLVFAAYRRERESTNLTQAQIVALIDRDISSLPKGEAATVKNLFESYDVEVGYTE